eukprot:1008301-Pelagomonas_calceolata.AAC.18
MQTTLVRPLINSFFLSAAALEVIRADVADKDQPSQVNAEDRFYIKTATGAKVTDRSKQEQVIRALQVLAEGGGQIPQKARPKFGNKGKGSSVSPLLGELNL